jgi:hypothetical protein
MRTDPARLPGLLLALVCLLPATPGAAEPEPRQEPRQQSSGEPPAKAGEGRQEDGKTAPRPARDFTPTDRISADSAVSFPVDI